MSFQWKRSIVMNMMNVPEPYRLSLVDSRGMSAIRPGARLAD